MEPNNATNYQPKYPVQTLSKALDIIMYLKNLPSSSGISILELSEALDMGRSSVHRILDTLLAYDFVEKAYNGSSYRLGWGLYDAGNMVPEQHVLTNANFYPIIEEVCRNVSETVNLGIQSGPDVIIIGKMEPNIRIRANINVGGREPLYCTALGKLFMSEFTVQEVKDYFLKNKTDRLTNNTIITAEDMLKELVNVKNRGYSVDMEEYFVGLICVAMPIRDHNGKIMAAISVSGPAERMVEAKRAKIISALKPACKQLSNFMGYSIKN